MPDATAAATRPQRWVMRDGVNYGALGAPLAFVALPLYVQWPAFAAQSLGLSLTMVGAMLLALRSVDALIDPWLGAAVDRAFRDDARRVWRLMAVACVLVAAGFAALFLPPASVARASPLAIAWSLSGLAVTYLGFSLAQIGHQAWGARLGGDAPYRARVVAAREGFALPGVMVASVLPSWAGWGVTTLVLTLLLVIAMGLLRRAPRALVLQAAPTRSPSAPGMPWRQREFRRLVLVYVANGMASAIPATLVLFYVRDHLQLPQYEGLFLMVYFAAAALSVPLWTRVVPRLGLVYTWAAGMGLAIVAFVAAVALDAGDVWGFAAVCVGTGLALGADLVAPPALLAGAIQRAGVGQQAEGVWFGWWNLCTKLNLALAAGLALPLLPWMGYQSGTPTLPGLNALVIVYAVVPCVIKTAALAILLRTRWQESAPGLLRPGYGPLNDVDSKKPTSISESPSWH